MIRRDLLSARRDDKTRDEKGHDNKGRDDKNNRGRNDKRAGGHELPKRAPRDIHIELATADHEEPTWEVRPAGDGRRRRIDRRTRSILSAAAAAAIVVNAGAAWSYWRITQPAPARSALGLAVELTLRARNDLNRPLSPGGTGNLTVTVTNEYDFPIRITNVTPGNGKIVADDEHREAGCTDPGVTVTQPRFEVAWDVPRNTIGAFTLANGLTMRRTVPRTCDGAVFTVPVRVSGFSVEPG